MDENANESFPRTSIALGVLTAIVYVAGFATVAAWFALLVLDHPGGAPSPHGAVQCGSCGVVQAVKELDPAAEPKANVLLEGNRSNSAVILIATLVGAPAREARPSKVYETAVLLDDGFLRVLRDTHEPDWQRGDRVRVITGHIARESPIPPVARAP
jgi:hypothetical protein